jgi:hypothetical protein
VPFLLLFSNDFNLDLDEALNYYASISPKIIDKFVFELREGFNKLEISPASFGFIGIRNYRRYLFKTFPYKIVYFIDENSKTVRITGLFHAARSNKYVKRRLG